MAREPKKAVTAGPPRLTVSIGTLFTLPANPGVPRWGRLDQHPLPGAVVTLRGTTTTATTNRYGNAQFATSALVGTRRILDITPATNQLSSGPAGPTHGAGGYASAPSFMFRPFSVTIDVDATGFLQTPAPTVQITAVAGTPSHAALVSVASTQLVLDCKPDWIKAPNRHAVAAKNNAFLVLHQTGGDSMGSALNTLTNAGNVAGIHYLVDVDGHAVKLVHESDRVNHTGPAFWDGNGSVNAQSIGIEIVHSDNLGLNIHNYEDAQYVTVLRLVRVLRAAYPTITRQHVVGHSDVETISVADRTIGKDRALDPGEAFAWDRFEAQSLVRSRVPTVPPALIYNIGPGQSITETDRRTPKNLAPDFTALQRALSSIGYSIAADGVTASGKWDTATKQAVNRFQRRYFSGGNRTLRPAGFVIGRLDYETAAAIASVAADTTP